MQVASKRINCRSMGGGRGATFNAVGNKADMMTLPFTMEETLRLLCDLVLQTYLHFVCITFCVSDARGSRLLCLIW